jgi:hypothetical protein
MSLASLSQTAVKQNLTNSVIIFTRLHLYHGNELSHLRAKYLGSCNDSSSKLSKWSKELLSVISETVFVNG